jgi:thiazole synthase ThiGH ThiG subunit
LEAAENWLEKWFVALAPTSMPIRHLAKRPEDVGCATVMLARFSNLWFWARHSQFYQTFNRLLKNSKVPVVVDVRESGNHRAEVPAMELGAMRY